MSTITNIIIEQGATFARDISLLDQDGQPLDVSSFTANAALKETPGANTAYVFDTNLTTGLLSLRMEANVTSTIVSKRYFYDVLLTNGTDTYRIMEGQADVTPQISTFNAV